MKYRWLMLFCLLLTWSSAWAASVQASLDRNDVRLGETVTLNLRIHGAMNASTPDLSALDHDFEVLGTSTNSTLSIVNGQQTSELIIGVALRPRHAGDLQIPSLTVAGSQTRPLTLHVGPPDTSASANSNKDVFIEASASTDHVYVGQQLLYTLRLFFDVNINNGSLPDPHLDSVDIRKLGGDAEYEVERNGRRYHVIERRYALIPQQAGSLTIPSVEFQGETMDPGNPNDPGNFFGPGGLFGNTTPVTVDSPAVAIHVQAVPSDWGKTVWLPARSLTLSLEGLPSDDKITAGQPLNLRMSIEAQGLPADALPEPSLPAIDGATVYPDQPIDTTHNDGQWLTGRRERSFAIFPQHAGSLTIPATTLTWYDVQSGQKRVTTLPAHTLTVVAAANSATPGSSSLSQPAATVSPSHADQTPAPMQAMAASPRRTIWRWVAIGSLALWLMSAGVFAWWYRRSRAGGNVQAAPAVAASQAALRQAFLEAARGADRSAQARSLLVWARAERPALRTLGQLAEAVASDQQREAIEVLQRQQYAGTQEGKTLDLASPFAKGFAWRHDHASTQDSPLPPLYPFKLD